MAEMPSERYNSTMKKPLVVRRSDNRCYLERMQFQGGMGTLVDYKLAM